jgi:AcrR family transcriptional regulator
MNNKIIDLQPYLRAALPLVAADGLKGLSLRPLAEQLGTTAPALIRRFGSKDEMVAALVEVAIAEDSAFLDGWLARIQALEVRDGALMAEVAEAVLSDLAGPEAGRTRFYCELLQAAASRPEIAEIVAAWSARRLAFWRAATQHLPMPEFAEILHGFSIGDAAYSLVLEDVTAYRWLRRLNLRRLCLGLIPADGSQDLRAYATFRAALDDLHGDQPATPPMSDWQAKAAGHISALIIAEGADAVTHRAIAARAGLANSTLAYHFPRQEDLLRAGLDDIVSKVRRATGATASDAPPDFNLTAVQSSRATLALALAAGRMPSLKPVAADLRRQRGESSVFYYERQYGERVFDVVSCQALSLTAMGWFTLDGLLEPAAGGGFGFALAERMRERALASR